MTKLVRFENKRPAAIIHTSDYPEVEIDKIKFAPGEDGIIRDTLKGEGE